MRRALLISGAVLAVGLLLFWALGGLEALTRWAAAAQRDFQGGMGRTLRALRGGEPGALWGLIGLCFAYGVVHAAGPGHGKVLIGGYGLGQRVALAKLSAVALVSSLAQAATAVLLVYGTLALLGWGGDQVEGLTEEILAPASYGAIVLIGLWLCWRGLRGIARRTRATRADAGHDHDHLGSGAQCESCGHAHAPSLEQVDRAGRMRDLLILVAGIAIRPCTGALFLLVITWRLGLSGVGIAGAFAMGLGTALVTIAVALLAVTMREGTWAAVDGNGGAALRVVGPLLEIAAGGLVALVAGQLLLRAI